MTPAALPPAERVVALDVVRGFALLGILVMNLPAYTAAGDPSPVQQPVDFTAALLRDVVFAGKFNSIFSLLFGLGFSLQLARLEQRLPDQARSIYLRRLAVLMGIGLVHALFFFPGDVLHMYALLSCALLWLRRWPTRGLVALMAVLLFGPAMVQLLKAVLIHQGVGGAVAQITAELNSAWTAREIQAYGHGNLLDTMGASVTGFVHLYTDPASLRAHLGFYAQVLTTMVLGMLIGRLGWLQQLPQRMPQLRRLQVTCLAIGVVSVVVYGLWRHDAVSTGDPALKALVGTCYLLGRLGLMGFYVLTLVRLVQHRRWQDWLAPFAAAGRMPLSNYLLQTLLCSSLFYGWGLGLWNQVNTVGELLIAPLIFFAVQLPLSHWWLRHFEQGPLEGWWRRITYGRN